jgi:hypothetical protein
MDSYARSKPTVGIQNGYQTQRPQAHHPHAPPATPNRMQNGTVVDGYALRSRYRIPTVDEALPFAPLTSIVPYSPGTLPLP